MMSDSTKNLEMLSQIVNYALDYPSCIMTITFDEGDSYKCIWDNGEYVDNEEELGSPAYEEWYELDFKVDEVLNPGPNKDPRFGYISISEKHMPSEIKCGETILYDKDRGLLI